MPFITALTCTIEEYVQRLNTTENNEMPEGDRVKVCAAFQRGDDATGVWPLKMKRALIHSILRGHPIGTIMLVKPPGAGNSTNHYILDGGNRSRVIRDFLANEFTIDTDDGRKTYSELDIGQQASFANKHLHLQQIRIERTDPHDTIAQMFTNLNTMILSLKDGELLKAHSWQRDIPIAEIAKQLVGGPWERDDHNDQLLNDLKNQWYETFPGGGTDGTVRETKRCDNISHMVGYMLSALYNNVGLFTNKFYKVKDYLIRDNTPTQEDVTNMVTKLHRFLDIIQQIDNHGTFFKPICGFPRKSLAYPIWGAIVRDTMTDEFIIKTVEFYNDIQTDEELRNAFKFALTSSGDSHTTLSKLEAVHNLIRTHNQ